MRNLLIASSALAVILGGCRLSARRSAPPEADAPPTPVEQERSESEPAPEPEPEAEGQPAPAPAEEAYTPPDFPAPERFEEAGLMGGFYSGTPMPGFDPYRDPTPAHYGCWWWGPHILRIERIEKAKEKEEK